MSHISRLALFQRHIVVVHQNGLILRIHTLLDHFLRSVPWAKSTEVCQPYVGHDHIDVMFGVVHVGAEGDNAGYAFWVFFSRSGRGAVQDGDVRVP